MATGLPLTRGAVKMSDKVPSGKSATLAGYNPDFSITEFHHHAPTGAHLAPAFVANDDCWPAMIPVRVGDQRNGLANGTKRFWWGF